MTYKIVRVQWLKAAVFIWTCKHDCHVFPGAFKHGTIETPQMEQDFSTIPVKTRKEEYLRRYSFFFFFFFKKISVEKYVPFDLSPAQTVFPYKRKAPLYNMW